MSRNRKLKAALVEAGIPLKEVAQRSESCPSHISKVIAGQRKSRRIMGILKELGLPEELLRQ